MTGVFTLARRSNDEGKRRDCLRLWKNMAQRQLRFPEASVPRAAA